MTWKKIKRMLLDHPYLIDDAFHMPMKQAMDLQEKEGYPSFTEMVLRAKQVSTAPASAWVPVDEVIARRQHKYKSLSGIWQRPPAKVALAGLCLLLLASYLAFAPSGRAFAAYVAKIVMQIVDNGFRFSPIETPGVSFQSDEIIPYEETIESFVNIDEAEKATNRELLRLEGDTFTLKEVTLYYDSLTGSILFSAYKTNDGLSVSIQQQWDQTASVWAETNDDDSVWEENLWDGTIVYCLIDAENSFNAMAVWRNKIINIFAESGVPYQDIIESLRAND